MPILKPYDPDMFAPGFKSLGTPTKGAVIAGNGSTWQKLTVGANGTVLTANSAQTTGLEWGAGGGGGGIYTVVSDEAGLIAALAAEDPLIYIDTSVTATQDYSVINDAEIRIGTDVTLNMTNTNFRFIVSAGVDFSICGDKNDTSVLSWGSDSTSDPLIDMSPGSTLKLFNFKFTELSPAAPFDNSYISSDNIIVNFCNVLFYFYDTFSGAKLATTYYAGFPSFFTNLEFYGGGPSCYGKVAMSNNSAILYFSNIFVSGVWQTVVDFMSLHCPERGVLNGLVLSDTVSSCVVRLSLREVSNVVSKNSIVFLSSGGAAQSNYATNISCDGLVVYNKGISNFYCNSMVTLGNNTISNGSVTTPFSANGNNIECSNVIFLGGASVGTNDISFTNCVFGNYSSPGTATTLTIDVTASRTIAVACKSDSAIVDSGSTGPQIANNTVF